MKKCPFCREIIQDTAFKCRYCGEWLEEKKDPIINKNIPSGKNSSPATSASLQSIVAEEYPENMIEGAILYAGFWKRVAASLIDGIITAIGMILVIIWFGVMFGGGTLKTATWERMGSFLGLIACWIYYAIMESSTKQATLGKMALGIKVTDLNGNRIDFGRATGRYFGMCLSSIILCIGHIMVAFTQKKQGLHDIMAGCLVVNRCSETSISENAETEKVVHGAELRSAQRVQKITTTESEVKQQNEEFIALLKSTINENGLNVITGDDLIEIYNRAKSIAAYSNELDFELSKAINALLEEIKKRGLSQESKPREISNYEESSFKNNQAVGWFRINSGYVVTLGIVIVLAIIIVFSVIKSNLSDQEERNKASVPETQESTQELTAEGWVNKANTLWVDGKLADPNKAIEYLNNAINLEPGYARAYRGRGITYAKLGQHQRAIEDYNEAIRLKPDEFKTYYNRGFAYADLGKHQQAIENYDQALRLKPNEPSGYYLRGIAYAELGQFKEAIENYSEAIRQKPDDADFYNDRGSSYLSLGNISLGCSDIKKGCALGTCSRLEWAKTNKICR